MLILPVKLIVSAKAKNGVTCILQKFNTCQHSKISVGYHYAQSTWVNPEEYQSECNTFQVYLKRRLE